jgi:TPR repeat protein
MEEFIQNYLESNNCKYIKIGNHQIINHIYNLYKYGIDERDTFEKEDSIIDLYYGEYYKIKKDYEQMKKYYLIAIGKGNDIAMNNLGLHYYIVKKDYEQMKKNLLMAIEKGNSNAMYNLGYYCQNIEKDYDQMKKYYLMAIEKGDCDAMLVLGYHYRNIEKDYDQMKKYYLMAIEKGHCNAMYHLEQFYKDSNDTLGLLQLYIKIDDKAKISDILVNYCNQKIVDREINSILLQYLNCIDDHDLPVIFKLFKQLFDNQIDLLEAHFKYSENGLGYEEAKQDFLKQLSS